jgi:hypothetical protein
MLYCNCSNVPKRIVVNFMQKNFVQKNEFILLPSIVCTLDKDSLDSLETLCSVFSIQCVVTSM